MMLKISSTSSSSTWNIICVMSPSEKRKKKEMKEIGEAKLGRKLCEFLKHKKCLVVMDDAWSSLRNDEIALRATNSQAFIHNLGFMDKDESWQLFLKKTFGGRSTTSTTSTF
ncbi:hypothetical protein VitviT2T_023911 [Vitis vinifera]|uniref:NB-ARC domain-containing protein n=3 Tax=Vitis vinifera TaxID=29760 RepID=A0ABY9DF06_VITVI|nr:hypothetical protein VitviT2T_023911 [Vitis vinifera]